MAHKVRMDLPERELGRSDALFKVKKNGKMFGTLAISNGSVVWYPRYTSYGYKMGWSKFDQVMKSEATRFEKR